MKENDNFADGDLAVEQQLCSYYSLYEAVAEYKTELQKQLSMQAAYHPTTASENRNKKMLRDVFSRPRLRWMVGILLLIIILLSLIAIQPVRAAIERLINFGYLEGAGFVRVSETYVISGPIYSIKRDQTIGIDRVIANPMNTQIWFHVTGVQFSPENVIEKLIAYLEVNGQNLQSTSYSWGGSNQEDIFVFGSLETAISNPFTLHISPDWSIPIQLIPMSSMDQGQTTTIYPDICQTHLDVEMCLRTFVSDSTGYHLWLSALSRNPIFYMQTLYLHDPLTGEDPILKDSIGHQLDPVYSSEPAIVMQVSPVITDAIQEVKTTLSFERSANESGSLELLVTGLTGKTPADETIICGLGNDPQIGDHFSCEKSITIAGEQIRFHGGEITQHSDGIHLTMRSDPIEASNGLLLTFVNAESLYYENSSLVGVGFDRRTNQLEIWLGLDSLSAKNLFAVKITSADLTILEPFRLSLSLNP